MIQTLTRNWLLLALCGVLNAVLSFIYFLMQGTDGPLDFYQWRNTILFVGWITLAAAACSIAGGIWRSQTGICWLLVLHGLALGVLGVIYTAYLHSAVRLRTISVFIILMAFSLGALAWIIAQAGGGTRNGWERWSFGATEALSAGFALAFFALGFGWIKISPGSHAHLLFFGYYFGFGAVFMLGLALRLHSHDARSPIEPGALTPAINRGHMP